MRFPPPFFSFPANVSELLALAINSLLPPRQQSRPRRRVLHCVLSLSSYFPGVYLLHALPSFLFPPESSSRSSELARIPLIHGQGAVFYFSFRSEECAGCSRLGGHFSPFGITGIALFFRDLTSRPSSTSLDSALPIPSSLFSTDGPPLGSVWACRPSLKLRYSLREPLDSFPLLLVFVSDMLHVNVHDLTS